MCPVDPPGGFATGPLEYFNQENGWRAAAWRAPIGAKALELLGLAPISPSHEKGWVMPMMAH